MESHINVMSDDVLNDVLNDVVNDRMNDVMSVVNDDAVEAADSSSR
ncbi:TPA: hypothetical protein ACLBZ1_002322 [Bacillus cereus]